MSSTVPADPAVARRAAVLGSPISHSRSPQLHLAAYRALGLTDWTYDRIECTAEQLPALVGGFGPEWVGVSVTMPGKFAALAFADERTARAELVGSANTLVHTERGWRADNTDVDGVVGALASASVPVSGNAVVVGAGGTAPAALTGLVHAGAESVTIAARNEERAAELIDVAQRLGVVARHCPLEHRALAEAVADASVVVSTVPADLAATHIDALRGAAALLDVLYEPWPTPLAAAVAESGGTVVSGLQMLLHQAFAQVEQFTGRPAPRAEMAAALQ